MTNSHDSVQCNRCRGLDRDCYRCLGTGRIEPELFEEDQLAAVVETLARSALHSRIKFVNERARQEQSCEDWEYMAAENMMTERQYSQDFVMCAEMRINDELGRLGWETKHALIDTVLGPVVLASPPGPVPPAPATEPELQTIERIDRGDMTQEEWDEIPF